MKIKKQCPECEGTNIFKTKCGATGSHGFTLLPRVGGTMWNHANFDVYICGTCGFYQLFVDEKWLGDVERLYEPHR